MDAIIKNIDSSPMKWGQEFEMLIKLENNESNSLKFKLHIKVEALGIDDKDDEPSNLGPDEEKIEKRRFTVQKNDVDLDYHDRPAFVINAKLIGISDDGSETLLDETNAYSVPNGNI